MVIRLVTDIKPDPDRRGFEVVEYEVYEGEILRWRRVVPINGYNYRDRVNTAREQDRFARMLGGST